MDEPAAPQPSTLGTLATSAPEHKATADNLSFIEDVLLKFNFFDKVEVDCGGREERVFPFFTRYL